MFNNLSYILIFTITMFIYIVLFKFYTLSFSVLIIFLLVNIGILLLFSSNSLNSKILNSKSKSIDLDHINYMKKKSFNMIKLLKHLKVLLLEISFSDKLLSYFNLLDDKRTRDLLPSFSFDLLLDQYINKSIMYDNTLRLEILYRKDCKKDSLDKFNGNIFHLTKNGHIIDLDHPSLSKGQCGWDTDLSRQAAILENMKKKEYHRELGGGPEHYRAINNKRQFFLVNLLTDDKRVLYKYYRRYLLRFANYYAGCLRAYGGDGEKKELGDLITTLFNDGERVDKEIFYRYHESDYGIGAGFEYVGNDEGTRNYFRKRFSIIREYGIESEIYQRRGDRGHVHDYACEGFDNDNEWDIYGIQNKISELVRKDTNGAIRIPMPTPGDNDLFEKK